MKSLGMQKKITIFKLQHNDTLEFHTHTKTISKFFKDFIPTFNSSIEKLSNTPNE